MEKSGPFNAELVGDEWDRTLLAEDIAEYFASFIGNGVYPNPASNLEVKSLNNNMQVTLLEGPAYIWGYFYKNTDDLKFLLDPADGVLNRIDRVVLRLDYLNREIKAHVKKGTFATNPVPPTLQRDSDMYELGLADVYVGKGVIKINQSNITDLRLNKSLCGIVHGTIDQVDTTEIFNQYQAWFLEQKTVHEGDFENWMNSFKESTGQKFTDWVNDLKNSLDPNEDVAAQLQMQITENKLEIESQKADIVNLESDYEYQVPTIVGAQIQLKRKSPTKRLSFYLGADLTGGNITISLDNGTTSFPLKDIEGEPLTELNKGYVEVVDNTTFFTYAPKGGATKINGIIKEYTVQAGKTINTGDFVKFIDNINVGDETLVISSPTEKITPVVLDNTRVLLLFKDNPPNGGFYGVVISFVNNIISIGAPTVINASSYEYFSKAILLEENKVLVLYTTPNLWGVVLNVTGNVVSVGQGSNIYSANVPNGTFRLEKTDVNKFIVVYSTGAFLYSKILSINGTTITTGVQTQLLSGNITNVLLIKTTNINRFAIVYTVYDRDSTKRNYLYCKSVIVNSESISIIGEEITIQKNVNVTFPKCTYLGNGVAFLLYVYNGFLWGELLLVEGDNIGVGNKVQLTTKEVRIPEVISLEDDVCLINYVDFTTYFLEGILLKINGGIILKKDTLQLTDYATYNIGLTKLDSNILAFYTDKNISTSYGNNMFNALLEYKQLLEPALNYREINGVSKQKGVAGEKIKVTTLGGN